MHLGRMAEQWEEKRQKDFEVAFARAEGVHEALPETLLESHQLIRGLQQQVDVLDRCLRAPWSKLRERLWGFAFGVLASLVATAIWPNLLALASLLR
jgi:hypothetical protein